MKCKVCKGTGHILSQPCFEPVWYVCSACLGTGGWDKSVTLEYKEPVEDENLKKAKAIQDKYTKIHSSMCEFEKLSFTPVYNWTLEKPSWTEIGELMEENARLKRVCGERTAETKSLRQRNKRLSKQRNKLVEENKEMRKSLEAYHIIVTQFMENGMRKAGLI